MVAATSGLILGTVVAVQANFYQVQLQKPAPCKYLLCTRRTRLKKIGQRVMVGDRVLVTSDAGAERGAIEQVLDRKTELERPPVANAEQIVLVFALASPPIDVWQLSKFLVKAESTSLSLCLCLNKADLLEVSSQQQWQQKLAAWGYQPLLISVATGAGLGSLAAELKNKISIVAGPSGVGKSSLINTLIPQAQLRTGAVSGKLQKGRHTTRHVELFELPDGGLIADSPGFNQPDLDCRPEDLALCFPEARARLAQGSCQFNDCLHRDEPNCVVRGNWQRYEHYLQFLDEVVIHQQHLEQTATETNLKLKTKSSGKQEYEPKLQTKKYRRISRREKHQNLQELENQSLAEIANEIEDY